MARPRGSRHDRNKDDRLHVLHVLLSHIHTPREDNERIRWPTREEAATYFLKLAVEVLIEGFIAWDDAGLAFRPVVLPGVAGLGPEARRRWYDRAIRYLEVNRDSGRNFPIEWDYF